MINANDCPDIKSHTPCPSGYTQRHVWAGEMHKTHYQVLCPQCNTYSVWVEREKSKRKPTDKTNKREKVYFAKTSQRLCEECNKLFTKGNKGHHYHCSDECFKIHERKQRNAKYGKGTGYRGRTKKISPQN